MDLLLQHPYAFVLIGFLVVPVMIITTLIMRGIWLLIEARTEGFSPWLIFSYYILVLFQIVNLFAAPLIAYLIGLSTPHILYSFLIGGLVYGIALVVFIRKYFQLRAKIGQSIYKREMDELGLK